MERREVLAFLGTSIALSGCVSDVSERSPESESSTTTEDCGWPQFCEGSTMVEVIVSFGFSGDVVLETGCRDEDFELQPGDTKTIKRRVDAETCDVTLYINGQVAHEDTIHDYVSTTLRINSSGEIDEERKEL